MRQRIDYLLLILGYWILEPKAVVQQEIAAARAGMNGFRGSKSPATKINGEKEVDGDGMLHFPISGSPYQKKMAEEMGEGDVERKHSMPPASVMTRLILIMVWRKLIRDPNT